MASFAFRAHIAARRSLSLCPAATAAPRQIPPIAHFLFRNLSVTTSKLERRYTKEHEWIDLSADRKTGVIGISEFAAEQLGDVIYVEIPEPGGVLKQGDTLAAVESVKSASDVNAPIRCIVTQANKLLEEKPAIINKVPEDDSHGGGWIAKVEVDEIGAQEFEKLMRPDEYSTYHSNSSNE